MKSDCNPVHRELFVSLPVRGAWIEIKSDKRELIDALCRSPCGERGLKCDGFLLHVGIRRRSPCGERGLKYVIGNRVSSCTCVAPRAGSVD